MNNLKLKQLKKKMMALISECSFNLSVIDNSLNILESDKEGVLNNRFRTSSLELLTSTYYIYPNEDYIKNANYFVSIFIHENKSFNLMIDEKFRISVINGFIKEFPNIKVHLNNFMKETNKILKDFRNQNFIEPTELTICVAKDEHKELLDI